MGVRLRDVDKQINGLRNEVVQRDAMVEELERVRQELEQQRDELVATTERLNVTMTRRREA